MEIILIIFVTLNTLILFQTFSIAHILLIAICNFFLSSALIAYNGHIFIAAIFLIVYTGAILVMICVAYLLTPSIQKKKIKKDSIKKQSDSLNIIFFNLFIILLLSSIILIQLKDNNELNLDLLRSNYIFERPLEDSLENLEFKTESEDLDMLSVWSNIYNNIIAGNSWYFDGAEWRRDTTSFETIIADRFTPPVNFETLIENRATPVKTGRAIYTSFIDPNVLMELGDIIVNSFQTINTINYTNTVSYIYTKHYLSFLAIGIYLLITLLICLRMFMIMAKSIIIKRQDIIDQILKIWKKS